MFQFIIISPLIFCATRFNNTCAVRAVQLFAIVWMNLRGYKACSVSVARSHSRRRKSCPDASQIYGCMPVSVPELFQRRNWCVCIWIKLWRSTMTKSSVNTVLVWIWNRNVRVHIPSCRYWYFKNANKAKLLCACVFTEMWCEIYYKQFDVVKQFIVCFSPPYRGKRSCLGEETARMTSLLSYSYAEFMKHKWRGPYWIPASASWSYFSIYIFHTFVTSFWKLTYRQKRKPVWDGAPTSTR